MIIDLSNNYILIDYLIAIFVSIGLALAFKVQLLPNKPYRYSFDISALYPTPIIATGLLSIFFCLNYYFIYNGIILALLIGIISAIFVKCLFFYVFPKPPEEANQ